MSQLDEVEYSRLAAQVQEIETFVGSGQSGKVGDLLKHFLHNAKSRMEEIHFTGCRISTPDFPIHPRRNLGTCLQMAGVR